MFIFQVCVDVCVVHHVCDDGVPGGLLLLPSQRGGVGVATGVSNRYVGIGVVTYTSRCRIDGEPISGGFIGRPEEDEEDNAPSHYGASVVRLFPRTNPIHVDMDVSMENRWRQVQMGYQLAVYQ